MEHVTRRLVPAGAPISVPAVAVSSPFAMARAYAGDRVDLDREEPAAPAAPAHEEKPVMNTKASGPGSRGPQLVTRAKETLKACGPLSLDQFAEGLGIERKKAAILAKNGAQRGLWTRQQIDGVEKLVLTTAGSSRPEGAPPSGFKRHLAKKAGVRVPAPKQPRAKQPAATHAGEAEGEFSISNTGTFRIEYAGQELKLPRTVTRAMVDFLASIDAALDRE